MDASLEKGMFLIATPGLRDPNFRQSVVLLCEHGPDGALGVVVNRPTEIRITEVLPQVPVLEGQSHMVFVFPSADSPQRPALENCSGTDQLAIIRTWRDSSGRRRGQED